MKLAEAKEELKRIGCGPATGNANRALYAIEVARGCCLSEAAEELIYKALQDCKDDRAIHRQAMAWIKDPLSVFEVL